MNVHDAWEKALRETEIIRSRVMALQTFSETHVPYVMLSASTINQGDTVVRRGEILVDRPSLILPPHVPQFDGFDFKEQSSFDQDAMINFLLVRGISLPSLRYDNKTFSLDVFEGKLDEAIKHFGNQMQREENTVAGLIAAPEDLWQFSLLIFICSQIIKNSSTDMRRLLDEHHRKNN